MGEAVYYMKARFASHEAAKKALPKVKRLISEGIEAMDWWQDHRDYEHEGKRDEFWKLFKKQFPLVTDYLASHQAGCDGHEHSLLDGDCNNDLAGHLEFGSSQDDVDNVQLDDDIIRFSATVWHFARWEGFMAYLKKLGAEKTGYVSDEYVNPMDLVDV